MWVMLQTIQKGQLHLGRVEEQPKFCFDVNYSGKYNTAWFFEVFLFMKTK